MNKKTTISTRNDTILKLKVLAKEKESVRSKLAVTAEDLSLKAKQLATTAEEKEDVRRRLVVTAKEKESVRSKLAVTAEDLSLKAKQLATTAKKKESVRSKLAVTAENLDIKAKLLATTAEEKEDVRRRLVVTAKEKESIRRRLMVTAGELRRKAKLLAETAKEKESIRSKLVVTAENLATTAEEKEDVRKKLEVTAEELKLKAESLAVIAEEKESIRLKLKATAENLATTAKEKEGIRKKLKVTAEELALTAKKIDLANKYSRSLIEASLDPLVTISPEGKVTDVNEATIKVSGVPREKLIGTDFSNYFTETEKASEVYQKVLKEGSVTDYPLTIKADDGRLTDVLYNASVYKDIRGNVLGVLAVARDVTEAKKANELMENVRRKLAVTAKEKESVRNKLAVTAKQLAVTATEKENVRLKLETTAKDLATIAKEKESVRRNLAVTAEELKESRETLEQAKTKDEAMLASIGDAVVAIDKEFIITLFNPAASRLTGFSSHEAIGKPMREVVKFVDEKNKIENTTFVEKALLVSKTKEVVNHVVLIAKTGVEVPVGTGVAPIFGGDGKVNGAIIVFRDVTKEREVVRMKDEFISVASHELRTPMTAISGFTSMILSDVYGPVNESLKEPLGYIMDGSDRLIKLVSDMLNVSRIEAGRLKFDLTNLDLAKLVNEAVKSLEPVAQERGITLSFKEAEVPPVQADADHVRQILNNLIGNALKFTDKGGSISVSLARDENFVNTDITDTGMGIALEDQKKLFEKFIQIASQESGRPQGTGLGLYISRELARKMGGELWIESSQIGKGSTFAFSLPLADTEEAKKIFDGSQEESKLRPDQKSLEEDIAKKRNSV